MAGVGLWGRDMGLEGKSQGRSNRREIYEMGIGNGREKTCMGRLQRLGEGETRSWQEKLERILGEKGEGEGWMKKMERERLGREEQVQAVEERSERGEKGRERRDGGDEEEGRGRNWGREMIEEVRMEEV